ncbi:MAG: hypothetical protein AAF585_11895 [Verrucomicrobiota bacterium]
MSAILSSVSSSQRLGVTATDIREMNSRFELPMCDVTTSNALAIALKRHFPKTKKAAVKHLRNKVVADIDGEQYFISRDAGSWLQRALSGSTVEPRSFAMMPASLAT